MRSIRIVLLLLITAFQTAFGQLLINPYVVESTTYTAEYLAILSEATTDARSTPSSSVKNLQNDLINSLKTTITSSGQSIWDELDVFQCYLHNGSAEFSFYNWKNPSGFEASRVNSITWAANVGFTGNASNMIVNSGFNPTVNGSKFTQNSAFMGVLLAPEYGVNANMIGTYTAFGAGDASSRNLIFYYTVGSPTWTARLNATSDYVTAFNKFTQKFYAVKRDNTTVTAYQGASSSSTTKTSSILVDNTIGVLGRKTSASQDQCSSLTAHFFFAGSKYAEEGLREILETYQNAVYQTIAASDTYLADYDFNDNAYLWKDAGKTVHPTDGEVIRAVANKNGTWGDLTAASDIVAPLYQTAIVNSLNAAEWDGSDDNFDFEDSKTLGDTGCIFAVVKNDDAVNGSHIISGGSYMVITGSTYSSNPGSGPYFTTHFSGGASASANVTLKDQTDGWNVIALRKNGDDTWSLWNGSYQKTTGTNTNDLIIIDMGLPYIGPGADWHMDGYIGRLIFTTGFMTDADVEAKIAELNTLYGL